MINTSTFTVTPLTSGKAHTLDLSGVHTLIIQCDSAGWGHVKIDGADLFPGETRIEAAPGHTLEGQHVITIPALRIIVNIIRIYHGS